MGVPGSMGGVVSKNCVNDVPVVHTPFWPCALIGRTRQKYVLFGNGCVGEKPVATVVPERRAQLIGEPVLRSRLVALNGDADRVEDGLRRPEEPRRALGIARVRGELSCAAEAVAEKLAVAELTRDRDTLGEEHAGFVDAVELAERA